MFSVLWSQLKWRSVSNLKREISLNMNTLEAKTKQSVDGKDKKGTQCLGTYRLETTRWAYESGMCVVPH